MKMTPREIELAYKGYRKRTDEQWEMVRISAYYSAAPHLKKDTFFLEDVKLPIDKTDKKKLTPNMIMKVTKKYG